ncbi:unnamed protein product [Dovyalis caffra]|uniref:Uncharacterized protein n=1 Tax=Dovyalis caffra TaxID=77055 RepID=A0AAV1RB22_9ROSI|nr:unnamed protein product [Dovyalis caffra]
MTSFSPSLIFTSLLGAMPKSEETKPLFARKTIFLLLMVLRDWVTRESTQNGSHALRNWVWIPTLFMSAILVDMAMR